MDNKITGLIGLALFVLFVGGLAQSIGHIPFTIIVILVSVMTIYGLYEDIKDSDRSDEG